MGTPNIKGIKKFFWILEKTRTAIVVSNGRYIFYQIHFITHNCLVYQISLIQYLLSNTFYQIPFIKCLLSNNVYQISFIKYHLQSKIFTSDRTLRSHFLYVCLSVCMSHNQIIRLNEKAKLIEN